MCRVSMHTPTPPSVIPTYYFKCSTIHLAHVTARCVCSAVHAYLRKWHSYNIWMFVDVNVICWLNTISSLPEAELSLEVIGHTQCQASLNCAYVSMFAWCSACVACVCDPVHGGQFCLGFWMRMPAQIDIRMILYSCVPCTYVRTYVCGWQLTYKMYIPMYILYVSRLFNTRKLQVVVWEQRLVNYNMMLQPASSHLRCNSCKCSKRVRICVCT